MQTVGNSEGQGRLVCFGPWGHKDLGHDLEPEQQKQRLWVESWNRKMYYIKTKES